MSETITSLVLRSVQLLCVLFGGRDPGNEGILLLLDQGELGVDPLQGFLRVRRVLLLFILLAPKQLFHFI